MDTLTFNSPILLRHLTFSEAKKAPIAEINLARVLEGMNMEMDQVRLSLSLFLSLASLELQLIVLLFFSSVRRPLHSHGL